MSFALYKHINTFLKRGFNSMGTILFLKKLCQFDRYRFTEYRVILLSRQTVQKTITLFPITKDPIQKAL